MSNNKVQIWLQTYQLQIFKKNQKDSSCEKYLNEDVYIAVLNGVPNSKFTKSVAVYSTSSIFLEKATNDMCEEEPQSDL